MNKLDIRDIDDKFNKEDYISSIINDGCIDIEFIFPSNFSSAKILRDFVEVICLKLNISSNKVSRIILVVDELNNNSIEYGSKKWDLNKMRFIVLKKNWKLEMNIEVEDSWNGKRPKKAMEMEWLKIEKLERWFDEHKSIRWRWLFLIIIKIVDELYFKDSEQNWLIVWVKQEI